MFTYEIFDLLFTWQFYDLPHYIYIAPSKQKLLPASLMESLQVQKEGLRESVSWFQNFWGGSRQFWLF